MTLPEVLRIFFAIELPDGTKENINKFIKRLNQKIKPRSIRWTKPENLHITLNFLAEVKVVDLGALIENVRGELCTLEKDLSPSAAFSNLEIFPDPRHPRVIVLDISPQDGLSKLAEAIGRGITKSHYPTERRPFRGHLTLGRVRSPRGLDVKSLSQAPMPKIEKISFNEVVLFRSEPSKEGSLYTVIERFSC